MDATSVICIPGKWESRTAIVQMIPRLSHHKYVFAGQILMNISTQEDFELEICEKDDRMPMSFAFAGKVNGIQKSDIDDIKEHNKVIYLSKKIRSIGHLEELADIASMILQSDGCGVKIESAGMAFSTNQWLSLQKNRTLNDLYSMFVCDSISSILSGLYSCGMHNLGLKDTIVDDMDSEKGQELIRAFNLYQLLEKPEIIANQTFSLSKNATIYRISEENNQPNKGYELFENPFGMWRLSAT
ncbi:hypothetical protein [Winogradskyella sp.]|uniref:hypothetical protein n=1 Tax=Winogradskyella sp. TaxID=1883156 RepID=UPI003BA86416